MARSSYIYLVTDKKGVAIAAFTVKHECATWCERVFSVEPPPGGSHQTTWLGRDVAKKHRIVRLRDNPSVYTFGYDQPGHADPVDVCPVTDWLD